MDCIEGLVLEKKAQLIDQRKRHHVLRLKLIAFTEWKHENLKTYTDIRLWDQSTVHRKPKGSGYERFESPTKY